ncbi:MAG: PTS sugar transporter subunit IIC [Streptococcaceae bacterium]|jgi:PTS system mannose-specific IIC component|nr:PTS sugar transporter subunit IIC [Streptococcaceae bacterium]
MDISLFQALAIATWVWLVQSRVFFGGATVTLRFSPLMTGLVCGIIMGDVTQAMIITAGLQVIYMGTFAPGGSMPSEPSIATAIAVPAALGAGLDPAAAFAIALPIGILGSYLQQIRFVLNTFVVHRTDAAAANLNFKKLFIHSNVTPVVIAWILHVPVIFAALFYGVPVIANAVAALEGGPAIHVLEVISRGLPAIGIAVTIYVIGKKQYVLFFLLSYFLSVIMRDMGVTMVTWAILGAIIAAVFVMSKGSNQQVSVATNANIELEDGDDEDF